MKKILFFIGVFLLLVPAVFADSASIGGDGNTVKILDDNQVQMVDETIKIDIHGSAPVNTRDHFFRTQKCAAQLVAELHEVRRP